MSGRRRLAVTLVVLALASLVVDPTLRRVRAGQLLLALAAQQTPGRPRVAAPIVMERELSVPGRNGPIRARIYHRADLQRAPGLVVAHGVHYQGIDERRLVPFARELARAGNLVLTPELSDLTDYRITRQGVDVITDSVQWLSGQPDVEPKGKVGLMGFSFAGGLSLVAAAQPELRSELSWVTSIGGHHDLERVLRFLVSDEIETPRGVLRTKAHEYGLVVAVYSALDRFVEPADRLVLRDALRLWLHGERGPALARASLRTTGSGERLFVLLESGRLSELRMDLARLFSERRAELRALSPHGRLADVEVPVYLLHGSADSVIPPSETEWADQELAGEPHLALVSPLLEHVEVSKGSAIADQLALVDFMARML